MKHRFRRAAGSRVEKAVEAEVDTATAWLRHTVEMALG
jgi:hypothetical protein